MITSLNKRQLSAILDCSQKDARRKIIIALKSNKDKVQMLTHEEKYLDESLPDECSISTLSESLNIPNLQEMVNDIHFNFFKRAATRKFILEFPVNEHERHAKKSTDKSKPLISIKIPVVYRSLISDEVQKEIVDAWREKYPMLNKYFI